MEIRWTSNAIKDLRLIYQFYLTKSEKAANAIYNEIIDNVNILKDFPQIAQIEPLLEKRTKTYRSLVVRSMFKVIYSIETGIVNIAAIWDCRRSPEKLTNEITDKNNRR